MVDNDGQHFHQYQQYEQSPRTPTQGTQKKPTQGWGQTPTYISFIVKQWYISFIV